MMDSYKNELQMMKVQQNESASQLQEMHDELMQDRGQQYENEIAGLLKQLDMLRKNMQDELDKKDAEIEKLKFELITAKNDATGAPAATVAPSDETEIVKNMLAEANDEMRKLKEELENCKGRLLAQPGDSGKDALLSEIENLKNMLAEANKEIKRLEGEVAALEKKNKSLIDENSTLRAEAEKWRRDGVILVEENASLKSSNSKLEMVKDRLSKMTVISSQAKFGDLEKKYKQLLGENNDLKNEINKLKKELSKCKSEGNYFVTPPRPVVDPRLYTLR